MNNDIELDKINDNGKGGPKMMTAEEIINNWNIAQKAGAVLPCPRCGKFKMSAKLAENALSRRADIYVCRSCETEEAFEDLRRSRRADDKDVNESISSWWLLENVLGMQNIGKDVYGNHIVKVKRELSLEPQGIDDIMVAALEGGINYWCNCAEVVEEIIVNGEVEKNYLGEYSSDQISRGGSLRLYDAEDDKSYVLTLEKFLNGIAIAMSRGYGDDWCDSDGCIDCGQIDAIGADAIVQCALFGEVIYG